MVGSVVELVDKQGAVVTGVPTLVDARYRIAPAAEAAARAFAASAGLGIRAIGAQCAVLVMRATVRLRAGAGHHRVGRRAVIALIRLYQREVSGRLPPRCAQDPSCSDYAAYAIGAQGLIRGGRRAVGQYRRCRLPERVG